MTPVSPAAKRRFVRILIAVTILYGLFAAVLAFRVVVRQQVVRRHLELALAHDPRRTFASRRAAEAAGHGLIRQLMATSPRNPCGRGPAFQWAQSKGPKPPACTIVIGVRHRRLLVWAYDTQGHRMDTIFERLNPPPRHLL